MTIAFRPPIIGKPTRRRHVAPSVPAASAAVAAPRQRVETVLDEDAQMFRAAKMGFLVGTPAVFAITAGIALVAGTTLGIAALIGAWSGLFGGWYFGSIFFINSKPRTRHPSA